MVLHFRPGPPSQTMCLSSLRQMKLRKPFVALPTIEKLGWLWAFPLIVIVPVTPVGNLQLFEPPSQIVKSFGGRIVHESEGSPRASRPAGYQNMFDVLKLPLGSQLIARRVSGAWRLVIMPIGETSSSLLRRGAGIALTPATKNESNRVKLVKYILKRCRVGHSMMDSVRDIIVLEKESNALYILFRAPVSRYLLSI